MRLPVYLQVALVLTVTALSARQEPATLPNHEDPVSAFMEEGTDVAVCRQDTPNDPGDLDTDTTLQSVRDTVEQLMASVPAEDATAFLAALEYQFGEVDSASDLNYLSMWDPVLSEWVTVCVNTDTYALNASKMSNPIEVVVMVRILL